MPIVKRTALALALTVACGAAAVADVLPSGTYRYAIHSNGKVTATSTIVIVHDAASVTVTEAVDLQSGKVRTTRVLDPATFSTLSWSGSEDQPPDSVTVAAKSATYRAGEKTTTLAAPGDGPSAVFDFFAGEFATLAATIHASGAAHYNEYCVCIGGFQTKSIAIVPATATRPPGASPGDAAIALQAEDRVVTLWYDPQTFVLRELDFPQQGISYVRI